MQRSLEPELLKSDGGAQPVKRWSDWRSNKAPSIESSSEESSIPSMDPSLARFHDHTDPEEDLEAWSREVAEEELQDSTLEEDQLVSSRGLVVQVSHSSPDQEDGRRSSHSPPSGDPGSISKSGTKSGANGAGRSAQRQLQLGEVNPLASSKAREDAKNFQAQLNRARRQLADLVQDKGELKQRLASAISEASKQSRRVNTIATAAKKLNKEKETEVENITAISSERAEVHKQQLAQKDSEVAAVRALLVEKESQHAKVLRQKEAMSTTTLQMLDHTRAAQKELQLAKEEEKSMIHQLKGLQKKISDQSSAHEEELHIAKGEAKKYRQAMSVMEERHAAVISGLMEQIVALKRKMVGPELEEKQRQMADRIIFLERECGTLRDAIMEGKSIALKVLKEKEVIEDEAKKLREEKSKLLEEGRRMLQERDAEVAIVMEQLRMVLIAKGGDSASIKVP
eukprot:3685277-Rhodomonas_salina.3